MRKRLELVERVCKGCGRRFSHRRWRLFCSPECGYAAKSHPTAEAALLSRRAIDPATGCWVWTGGTFQDGYGRVTFRNQTYRVHRLAAMRYLDFDPASELHVLHRCDNRLCFNPEHLFVGTAADNNQDMVAKGRHRSPMGSHKPNAKLTEADVQIIRSRLAAGESQRALAAEFAVTQMVINRIAKWRTWTHVP